MNTPNPYALNIYTDGSALKNPGVGGIGIRFIFPDFLEKEDPIKDFLFPGFKGTTNQQMEIKACIVALDEAMRLVEISKINTIIIYTDSLYVVNNYKKAIFYLPSRGWMKHDGSPVLNVPMWKELTRKIKNIGKVVEIKWVKGHSNNIHNKAVDKIAKQSARQAIKELSPTTSITVRKKKTKEKTERGSVKMLGQMIKIRIITNEYLREQKIAKIRYEVISKNSKFYNKVDFIYSKKTLSAGHSFLVSFNKNDNFPQISRVFKEII